jgi:hypothetical protein
LFDTGGVDMVAFWLTIAGIFLLASFGLWLFFDVSVIAIIGGFFFLLGLNMVYPPIFIFNGWYLGWPGPEDALWVLLIMKICKFLHRFIPSLTKIHAILISFASWFFWKSVIATLFVKWGESMMGLDPSFRTWILDKIATLEIGGISINFVMGVVVAIPAVYFIIKEWWKPW